MTTKQLLFALSITAMPICAQTWTEANAGELTTTAEATVGTGPLTTITGSLSTTESADLYLIRIDDPVGFTCSSVGGATFDSQMWMVSLDGYGISARDDNPVAMRQSTLTGQFVTAPGRYLVGISRYDNDPLNQNGDELWADAPYSVERQPDGPGIGTRFTQWSGLTSVQSDYTLTLTGASFAAGNPPTQPDVAWAFINAHPGHTTWTPFPYLQHTASGELITAERVSQGVYVAYFPSSFRSKGVPQVSAMDGATAVLDSWGYGPHNNAECRVRVYNTNGALSDTSFFVNYRDRGPSDERSAYVYADLPHQQGGYTTGSGYAFNGSRGTPVITRTAIGSYTVRFPGLGTPLAGEYGNPQASAETLILSTVMRRASIATWGPDASNLNDLLISVRTHDAAGNLADGVFVVSYVEEAGLSPEHLGSGAHVLADNPTAASYTPSPFYSDNNVVGAGPTTINRTGVGQYDVVMPGVTTLTRTFLVTGVGGNNWATIEYFNTDQNGTTVSVAVRDFGGAFVDGRFNLFTNNNAPAGTPATNTTIGTGCGGVVLSPINRPVLDSSWNLFFSGLPALAPVAVVSLGFNNPRIPLDFLGAPGCWGYQDQATLATVWLPGSMPDYSLMIPATATLVGLEVYAQGAVFSTGINPLNLATSNGLKATIGDV